MEGEICGRETMEEKEKKSGWIRGKEGRGNEDVEREREEEKEREEVREGDKGGGEKMLGWRK